MLAFVLTPEWAGLIGLTITTLGSIASVILTRRAHGETKDQLELEQNTLSAVIRGVQSGVNQVAIGGAPLSAIKTAIKTVATNADVQEYLDERVQALTSPVPGSAAPPATKGPAS